MPTFRGLATYQDAALAATDRLLVESAAGAPRGLDPARRFIVNVVSSATDVELKDPLVGTAGAGEIAVPSGSLVQSTKATAHTLTVTQADVSDGWTCTVAKWAAGDVTIAAGTGLTLRTAVSATIFSQYGMLQATRVGSDLLVG